MDGENVVDGGGPRCSLWHRTFQKVRDQPGGPRQLTAAAFPSPVRTAAVVVETVSGEDSRKGRQGWEWDGEVCGDLVIIWHSSAPFITSDNASHVGVWGVGRYRGERGVGVGKRRDAIF